jgi:hypothetical protein
MRVRARRMLVIATTNCLSEIPQLYLLHAPRSSMLCAMRAMHARLLHTRASCSRLHRHVLSRSFTRFALARDLDGCEGRGGKAARPLFRTPYLVCIVSMSVCLYNFSVESHIFFFILRCPPPPPTPHFDMLVTDVPSFYSPGLCTHSPARIICFRTSVWRRKMVHVLGLHNLNCAARSHRRPDPASIWWPCAQWVSLCGAVTILP